MRMPPAVIAVIATSLMTGAATAQELKCPNVRMVVPFGSGGAADILGRVVAESMTKTLDKTFVVENRPGATGNIGTIQVVNAKPDGCTLLLNATVIATFPYSFPNLGYDPFADLVPIGGIAATPNVLVASPSVPAATVGELLKLARGQKTGINYSTSGYGLQQHLVVEQMAQLAGAKFTLVAYRTPAAMMTDIITGRVEFGSLLVGSTKSIIEEKKLRALAVVQDQRTSLLPDVPTTAEQGFPGLLGAVQFLLFAPGKTPKDTVSLLENALHRVISDESLKSRFIGIGFESTPMKSAEVVADMIRTRDAFAPIIRELKIELK